MKQAWDNYTQKVKELSMVLEDILAALPHTKKFYRLKNEMEKAWKEMKRAGDYVDNFISEKINPLDVKPPWDHPKFWEKWQFYKDYLLEQWNFTMTSRMEVECLESLKNWTGNDPEKATRWLSYYITNHYNKVFKVKEEEENESTTNNKKGYSIKPIERN